VVAVGDGFEWKQSKLGILLSDEVNSHVLWNLFFNILLKNNAWKLLILTYKSQGIVIIWYVTIQEKHAIDVDCKILGISLLLV
jgi:hypothetical protein